MPTPKTLELLVSDERIAQAKKTNRGVYRFNTNDGNGADIYATGFEGGMQVARDIYEPDRNRLHAEGVKKDELLKRIADHLTAVREVLPYIPREDAKEDSWSLGILAIIDNNLTLLNELDQ